MMSHLIRNTVMAVTVAAATMAGKAGACAQDPTQGRINARQVENRKQYFRCAEFSFRVMKACLARKSNGAGQCRNQYQGNLSRCRSRFL